MRVGKGSAVAAIIAGSFGPAQALGASTPSAAFEPGLHTYYTPIANGTQLLWSTCGKTSKLDGCFGAGTIAPLSGACAILEGAPVVSGRVSQQAVYVMQANQSNSAHALLNVYLKTDTAAPRNPLTRIVLQKTIDLGLPVPKNPSCYMGANGRFIYAGTNASTFAVQVNKKTLAVLKVADNSSPPEAVHSITTDEKGNVSISFGTPGTAASSFFLFHGNDPGGEYGGLVAILPNASQGVSLK